MTANYFTLEKNFLKGLIFGAILCIGQINIAIGLPITLFFLFVTAPRISIKSNSIWVSLIVLFQILWLTFVWLYFKSNNITMLFQSLVLFLILAALLLIKCDSSYIKGMSTSIACLFILDLVFNLISIAFGKDPLGRNPDFRVSDIMPRLGGIFGHNFFSLNISVIGFFSGLLLKNKYLIVLSLANMFINGSLRSWVLLVLIFIAYLFVRHPTKFRYLLPTLFSFIIVVFAATIFAATKSETGANVLRVFAWNNAIEKIINNPIHGNHNFLNEVFVEGINENAVEEYGIAESQYLQLGLDYGILAMIGYFFIILFFLIDNYKKILNKIHASSINKILALSSIIIFVDTWYGSIFGSVLTTFFFGLIFLSLKNNNINS